MSTQNQADVAPQEEDARQEPAAVADDRENAVDQEPAEGEPADELASLSAALAEAQGQAAEYLDGWQRARAEFANYRRRQEQQHKQQSIAAQSRLLTQLLPVIDDLERAFEVVPDEIKDDPWVGGILMVRGKWVSALEKVGLTEVPAAPGDRFDPNCHDALTHEPNEAYAEGTVIQVVRRGYQFDGMVLRPALVRVSRGAPEAECEQEETESDA